MEVRTLSISTSGSSDVFSRFKATKQTWLVVIVLAVLSSGESECCLNSSRCSSTSPAGLWIKGLPQSQFRCRYIYRYDLIAEQSSSS
jgi:hypothetical protein